MLAAIRRPTLFDTFRLFFVGAIWGSTFIFVSILLTDFQPISIAAWRVLLAAAVLILISFLTRSKFPRGVGHWRYVFVIGALNSAVPFFLIGWGQQFISSAESALLMAMGTFFALVVSHFTSEDERINLPRALGVSVGFMGVLVLVFWDLMEMGLGGLKGQIAVMAAGCSYALSTVIARRITHLPSISTSAATMMSASLYMVPLAFLLENPLPAEVSNTSIVSLLFLGVVATALAITIRFTIIRANGAVFMAQVGYLVPLFGVIWSGLYFADAINLQTILSLVLILAGIAITRKGN
jgi:drug/metabolite transporter (DMT)-like permease